MASVGANVEWRGAEYEARLRRADRLGVRAMADLFIARCKVNLNRAGTPTSATGSRLLQLGRKLLRKAGTSPVQRALAAMGSKRARDAVKSAEAIESASGGIRMTGQSDLVDPPGGMPRRRTGRLMNSDAVESDGDGLIAGFSAKYAAIHEFGGTTPGGQPYMRIFGAIRFLRRGSGTALNQAVRFTKPSVIPPRPYLRPTLMRSSNDMVDVYVATVKREMGDDVGSFSPTAVSFPSGGGGA